MRWWTAGLLALGLLTAMASVSVAAPHRARSPKASHLVYLCPNCGVGADHAAACPICHKAMGRVATYACLKCQISSDRPGPCPQCHEPMKYLPALYQRCPTCGFYYPKSKHVCPVCAKRHQKRHR